jgi:hypothetical protein
MLLLAGARVQICSSNYARLVSQGRERDLILGLAVGQRLASRIAHRVAHVVPDVRRGLQEHQGPMVGELISGSLLRGASPVALACRLLLDGFARRDRARGRSTDQEHDRGHGKDQRLEQRDRLDRAEANHRKPATTGQRSDRADHDPRRPSEGDRNRNDGSDFEGSLVRSSSFPWRAEEHCNRGRH